MTGTGRRQFARAAAALTGVALVASLAACGSDADPEGAIEISGSATVEPITQAVADRGGFDVAIRAEGTTDGFERFCAGETAVHNASVPVPGAGQLTDFLAECERNDVEFVEIPVALDALTLVVHATNTFARDLTMDEVRRMWEPGSEVTTWADVRPEWPDDEVSFYGRPDGSGTFEYFSYQVSGEAGELRDDYRATDDVRELAGWLAEDPQGMGFMGAGNYLAAPGEDRDRITNVAIDGVVPTREEAQSGEYRPFTRPLFVYVNTGLAAEDEDVTRFVDYYVDEVQSILPLVYFYPLPDDVHDAAAERWHDRTPGTMFGGDPFGEVDLSEALGTEG